MVTMALYLLGYAAVATVVYFAFALRAPHMAEPADFRTVPGGQSAEVIEIFPSISDEMAA